MPDSAGALTGTGVVPDVIDTSNGLRRELGLVAWALLETLVLTCSVGGGGPRDPVLVRIDVQTVWLTAWNWIALVISVSHSEVAEALTRGG
jgi:hypothetical protein